LTQDILAASAEADEVVPLVEETARIGTRERVTGRVRVSTTTDVVEELARADLRSDVVEVTRVPIDRPVDTAPDIRTEGDVTIVPVLEEILIVEKRLVLKEELHIRRRLATETVEVPVELRRQRAAVERIPADEETGDADTAEEQGG
jgi:stress response protein YsnF